MNLFDTYDYDDEIEIFSIEDINETVDPSDVWWEDDEELVKEIYSEHLDGIGEGQVYFE